MTSRSGLRLAARSHECGRTSESALHALRLLGLALWVISDAVAQPAADLTATAAWKGWSRPQRATEIEVRLRTATSTRAALTIVAGSQSVHTALDAEAGRIQRMHVPIGSAESVAVVLDPATGAQERREVRIAQSESPLLGVALVVDDPVAIEGFQSVLVAVADLPHSAQAYASIDALVIDAQTLGALDQRQLAALIAYLAACGRAALVDADGRLSHAFDDAAGCGGRFLVSGETPSEATQSLKASLGVARPPAMSLAALGDLARPDESSWSRVVVVIAAYLCAASMVVAFSSSIVVLVLTAALATCFAAVALFAMAPPANLLVWSEMTTGSRVAGYVAWQRFASLARSNVRVRAITELGAVRSCDPNLRARFEFDFARGEVSSVAFDTRLFQQVWLCYAGIVPVDRSLAAVMQGDDLINVVNTGTLGTPAGVLLANRAVYDLPALGAGREVSIPSRAGKAEVDPAATTSLSRIPVDGRAALWALELPGVTSGSIDAKAWLLLRMTP